MKASKSIVGKWRWRIAQSAEIRWWRRYLGQQDVEQYLSWKKSYWKDFLSRIGLEIGSNAQVLDAGCGPAGIFILLSQHRVVAVDPLIESYSSLAHFQISDYPNVDFRAQTLESFHSLISFDYVFCLNVINHVHDLCAVLQVLAKALHPDGTLVLSVDAHRHKWIKPLFRAIPGDVLHPHQYDLAEYLDMCQDAGLTLVSKTLFKRESIFDYYVLILQHARVSETLP